MTAAGKQAGAGLISALLVLDLQVDFLEPNGRMPIAREQIAPVLAAANRAIAAAGGSGMAVVYVGNEFTPWDIPGNWFRHGAALRGTPGAALDPRLRRLGAAPYFAKRGGDAFANPALVNFVRTGRITRVVLCGVYADACVSATARGALGRGLRVTVLADAVGAASEAARRRALTGLGSAGVGIETTADFVTRLAANAAAARR
ncbi:MAG TPA: isochorismatase family cysteine hydrolase [Candidatus Binataceae bacterium]|jgi:nicotinamidase-related amidase|nr:isochorismatase family cysteine hydrolase [Candidatus Binataceae bacterium]